MENQALARGRFRKPEDVVAWFGAVQAQDYLGSLWALGLRMARATEADVEEAETRRAIVRTWPMRGTLHFVAAADVRWMTRLLAPRVIARNAARIQREVDVDANVIGRCRDVVRRALEGSRRLERGALYQVLEARGIRTDRSRGLHILGWLAMEGTLCLAGRSGKQHTFTLLEEWIPPSPPLELEAALGELAVRYFTSHGPAPLEDLTWWAGITVKDAEAAVDAVKSRLVRELVGEREYFRGSARTRTAARPRASRAPCVKLLPGFDEYTVAYRDRSAVVDPRFAARASAGGMLHPLVVVDGRVAGTWRRARHVVAVTPWRALSPGERRAVEEEAASLPLPDVSRPPAVQWSPMHNTVVQKVLRRARHGDKVFFIPGNHDEVLREYAGIAFGDIRVETEWVHRTIDGRRYWRGL